MLSNRSELVTWCNLHPGASLQFHASCSGKCWVINPCALVLACWRPDFCLALWMHCSQVQLLISCLWPETISHKPLFTVAWLAWRPALLSPAEKGALEWLIWDIQIEWLLKIILIPCQLVKEATCIIWLYQDLAILC